MRKLQFITASLYMLGCGLGFTGLQATDVQSDHLNDVLSGTSSTIRNQDPSSQVNLNSDDQEKGKENNVTKHSEKVLTPASAPSQKNNHEIDILADLAKIQAMDPSVSTFVDKVKDVKVDCVFSDDDDLYTIFIPTNEAFSKLPKDVQEDLYKPENKEKLCKLLAAHVLSGPYKDEELKSRELYNFNDEKLVVKQVGNDVFVGEAKVLNKAIVLPDGVVVFIVDKVILPPK